MTSVGWSTLDVIPSVKNLRSTLERQTAADFAAAGRRGGQQFGDAAGREAAGRFKSRFSGATRDLFAPAVGVLAGAGLVRGLQSVVDTASAAQQSVGGARAVFKDYADEVIRDSKRADQALGLSSTAYQELVTVSGALLKNKGLEDFAEQSQNLIAIGADLSAQFGGPTRQAVEALNAALRGESDPIERYGITLNETAVNAVLAANGQKALTGAALDLAKTQARLKIITEQSADAQGAFAREVDTQAGASARASAQWENMRAELGAKLLPATQEFTNFLNHEALPALESTGGVVADAGRAFGDLPGPVKAATGALVAFRLAQAAGVGSAVGAGTASLSAGLDTLRLRTMLAADEYRNLRTATLQTTESAHVFTPAVGRMSASLGALRAASTGVGASLKRGLSGATALVGGPWGAAFIAGTAIVAKFWGEHREAQARIEEFTATLDKETGALTENSREFAKRQLLESGALKASQDLGLSLSLVTDAALGDAAAIQTINAQLSHFVISQQSAQAAGRGYTAAIGEQGAAANLVSEAIGGLNGVVRQGSSDAALLAAAQGSAASATAGAAGAIRNYAGDLKAARDAVQGLLDKENERRNANLGAFQDQTRLAGALADARKEAEEGKRTLDKNAEAGRENRDALAALAGAWNDSAASVKNAKGAYREMRQNFIDVAMQMGAGRVEARNLADDLLGLPKKVAPRFSTPGLDAAIAEVGRLKSELAGAQALSRIIITAQGNRNRNELSDRRFAGGGLLRGPGSGTSDSILMWGSNGEFMQRKAAVDYYGVEFMRRLNNLQIPKFAGGGPVGAVTTSTASPVLGQEIRGTLAIDRDGIAYIYGVARDTHDAAVAQSSRNARLASLDGIRR